MSKAVKKIATVVVAVAASFVIGPAVSGALGAVFGTTAAGAISTAVSVAAKVVTGALVGGITSKMSGGSFKEGAIAGGLTAGLLEGVAQATTAGVSSATEAAALRGGQEGLGAVGDIAKDSFNSLIEKGKGLLNMGDTKIEGAGADIGVKPGLELADSQAVSPVDAMENAMGGSPMDVRAAAGPAPSIDNIANRAKDYFNSKPQESVMNNSQVQPDSAPPPQVDVPDTPPPGADKVADNNTIFGIDSKTFTENVLKTGGDWLLKSFEDPAETYMDRVEAMLHYNRKRHENFGLLADQNLPQRWGAT